jgi:cyclic beta-1,2-glucan synthetase
MLVPAQSVGNLRRLAALGLEGDYGFYDAIDFTDRTQAAAPARSAKPSIVPHAHGASPGDDLVALANALLDDRMVARFHRDPRVRATELLLQERRPRDAPARWTPPGDEVRTAEPAALPVRHYRTPHTVFPHAQALSNGRLVSIVTNAGGGICSATTSR